MIRRRKQKTKNDFAALVDKRAWAVIQKDDGYWRKFWRTYGPAIKPVSDQQVAA